MRAAGEVTATGVGAVGSSAAAFSRWTIRCQTSLNIECQDRVTTLQSVPRALSAPSLRTALQLRSGQELKNRLMKAAMNEAALQPTGDGGGVAQARDQRRRAHAHHARSSPATAAHAG